jgi:DNA-binding MarR family transcriptional regulator
VSSDAAASLGTAEYKVLLRNRLTQANVVDPNVIDRMEIMFDLTRLAVRLTRDFETVHRPRGWTWAGFRIVNMLWAVGDLEPRDLARLSGASAASISSALRTLEADGFIARDTKAFNRRLVQVSLTAKGHRALTAAIGDQAARERAWLAGLTADERTTLGKLLSRLAEQLRPD